MNFKIDCDNYSEKICKFKEIFKILYAVLHVKAAQLMGVDMYVCILWHMPRAPFLLPPTPELYFSLEYV